MGDGRHQRRGSNDSLPAQTDSAANEPPAVAQSDERIRRVLAWRDRLVQTTLLASAATHVVGVLLYAGTDPAPIPFLLAVGSAMAILHLGARYLLLGYWWRAVLYVASVSAEIGLLGAFAAWSPPVVFLATFGTVFAGLLLGRPGALALPLVCLVYLLAGYWAVQAGWTFPIQPTLDDPAAWWRITLWFACLGAVMVAALRYVLRLLDTLREEASVVLANHELEAARLETSRASRRATEGLIRDAQKLQTITQLSGGLAHLLNNTLTVVRSAAEELASARSRDVVHHIAAMVIASVRRASTTTNDLLAFSRREQPPARPVALQEELAALHETCQDALPENISLTCETPPTPAVRAEPVRIRQALLNLVLNARDAIDGSGSIVVRTGTTRVVEGALPETAHPLQPGQYVTLTVIDTGQGMTADVAPRACEPFFTTKDPQQHEGLGLFVVFGILEQWGGSLAIRSAPGEGTAVTVYLPVAEARAEDAEPAALASSMAGSDRPASLTPVRSKRPSMEDWKHESLRRIALITIGAALMATLASLMHQTTDPITTIGSPIVGILSFLAWRYRRTPPWLLLGTVVTGIGTITTWLIVKNGYNAPAAVMAHMTIVLVVAVHAGRWATWVVLVGFALAFVVGSLGPVAGTWHDANVVLTVPQNWLRVSVLLPVIGLATANLVLGVLRTATNSLQQLQTSLERLIRARREREDEDHSLTRVQTVAQRATRLETVGQAAGAVAHDLNNTLTGILGWASLLADDPDPPLEDIRDAAGAFREAADFGGALLTQLEPHSSLDPRREHSSDLGTVVENSRSLLQRLVRERIVLVTELKAGCSAPIAATDLRRILMNLAANARDAMPAGGRLSLRCSCDRSAEQVVLEVEDTGIGMDEQTRGRVFDAFFTTKSRGRGTGLGLHTVARIVEATGGRITVSSQPNQGTHFTLRWPRTESAERPPAPVLSVRANRQGRVLLAEDNDWVRQSMVRGLERAGYEVVAAVDGTDACTRMAQREDWDALCTDAIMPGESSKQVIERFATRFPGRPILLCSGHLPREVEALANSKHVRFLPKPFGPSALVRALNEELDRVEASS